MNNDPVIDQLAAEWETIRHTLKTGTILDQAITLQQIPAPTFEEKTRAAYVKDQFHAIGLNHIEHDEWENVYGWLGNPQSAKVVLVSAHLDTVFPQETDLAIRYDGGRVYGPGLGDNSLGVAALLILAQTLVDHSLPNGVAVCFAANSREEGLGNLDGIRAVAQRVSNIKAAIVIEGIALGRIYHGGIAVRRLRIDARAEGGHSWLNFGRPSAIHGLVQFAADITHLKVPTEPRTTYNIGLIGGGHSVNSIATDAHLYLDLRSTSTVALGELEQRIHELAHHHQTPELVFTVEKVGDRPAGSIPSDHPLVKLALSALTEIGLHGGLEQGSTDANVLLAQGIPSVVVGVTYGGNAHRLDEFIETSPLTEGVWHLILLVGAAIRSV